MLTKLYHKIWAKIDERNKQNPTITAEGLVKFTDLFYGENKKNNRFDFYRPATTNERLPTIFMFHGGGYVGGFKEGTRNFCQLLALKGYNVFNLEYSRSDDVEHVYFPAPIYEFYEMYKYISFDPAFEDLIDFKNIFIAGTSSGAHIAALISNIQTNPQLKMLYDIPGGPIIKGTILICPSFGAYKFHGCFLQNYFYDVIFGKESDRSPLSKYTHNLDLTTDTFPPCLMFSVKGDMVVGAHKKKFLRLAHDLELSVKHYEICSGHKLFHTSLVRHAQYYPECLNKIADFVEDAKNNIFVDKVVTKDIFEEDDEIENENNR